MSALTRSVAVEAKRLPLDTALLGCALAAALFAAAVLLALTDRTSGMMSPDAVAATALVDVTFVAAAFGAIRAATRFASGLFARDCLACGVRSAWLGSMFAAASGGGTLGVLTVLLLAAAAAAGGIAVPGSLWPGALVLGAAAGLWGCCIGSIARVPLAVLLIAAATLSPALLLADVVPELAIRLPLGAALAAAAHPLAPSGASVGWLSLAWLALALAASAVSTRQRSRL